MHEYYAHPHELLQHHHSTDWVITCKMIYQIPFVEHNILTIHKTGYPHDDLNANGKKVVSCVNLHITLNHDPLMWIEKATT